MDTPDALSLFNGLLHKGSWVVLMKLENAHKFLNSTALRPLFSKQMQHLMVGRRPFLAPALERFRIIKSSRSLLKQRKIVQWIKDILLTCVRARMTSKQGRRIQDIHMKRIGFDGDIAACTTDRHRVAVRFKSGLTVGGEPYAGNVATIKLKWWQRV